MTLLIILTILAAALILVLLVLIYSRQNPKDKITTIVTVFSSILLGILVTLLMSFLSIEPPTAIDVYRNKTELQVEGYYRDSTFVVTDSVVVFKNND